MIRVCKLAVLLLAGCSTNPLATVSDVAAPVAPAQPLRHEPLRTVDYGLVPPLGGPERNQGVAPRPRTTP